MTEKKIYRLIDLVRRLDRDKSTLIRWEAEGRIPGAKRDVRGWRYYTPEDFHSLVQFVETEINFHEQEASREHSDDASVIPQKSVPSVVATVVTARASERAQYKSIEYAQNAEAVSQSPHQDSRMRVSSRNTAERASAILYTVVTMLAILIVGRIAVYTMTALPGDGDAVRVLTGFGLLFAGDLAGRIIEAEKTFAVLIPQGDIFSAPIIVRRNDFREGAYARFSNEFNGESGVQRILQFVQPRNVARYFGGSLPFTAGYSLLNGKEDRDDRARSLINAGTDRTISIPHASLLPRVYAGDERLMEFGNGRDILWHTSAGALRAAGSFVRVIVSTGAPISKRGEYIGEFMLNSVSLRKIDESILNNVRELTQMFRDARNEVSVFFGGFRAVITESSIHWLDQWAVRQGTVARGLLVWNRGFGEFFTRALSDGAAFDLSSYGKKITQASVLGF